MKNIKRIALTIALAAAAAGAAEAQISNTLYFQDYNYRTRYINPAEKPEGKFYMGIPVIPVPVPALGTIAFGAGNNSFSFSDLFKNVQKNGKPATVFCLDSSVPNGTQDFLGQIPTDWKISTDLMASIIEFGFRVREKNYFTFQASLKAQANVKLPKEFLSLLLDGFRYDETFDLDIKNLGVNVNSYLDLGLGYTRDVSDKLTVGGTFHLLRGLASAKTDFKDLAVTASADSWKMSGQSDIYVSFPNMVLENKGGHFDNLDYDDGESVKPFQNMGVSLDLGAKYKLLPKLTLSASLIDFGFINYNKSAANIRMQQDFNYSGGKLDIVDQSVDFDGLEDSFNDAFIGDADSKFKQALTSKIYLGAEYDLLRWVSVGALSRTSLLKNFITEQVTISGNIHPCRLISANIGYNIYDFQWNSLSAGASINLGPFNIFAAMDNIPLKKARINGDFSVPANSQMFRINLGFGFTLGYRQKKHDEEITKSLEFPEADYFDADGDGVEDSEDKCPDTPSGIEVDLAGCPVDADSDKVPDYLDKCPDTPDGVQVDTCGCPVDSDGDNVPDYLDKCPDTPKDMEADENGCPIDADSDGVTDMRDKCPDTPAGAKVDADGCPLDTDGDGVPDYKDKCPEIKGVAANNGCPEVKQEVKQLFRRALNGIQFQSGSSTILRSSYTILDQIANTMIMNPDYKLYIAGHTDNTGNADMNLQLSKDRAKSVKNYLINKGVEEGRLSSEGFGDTKPVVPNNSAANRAKNRRVELEVEF